MYPSNNDAKDNVDVNDNTQLQQTNTSPITSNRSQSSSPSGTTLLVIDDTSNSEDSTINNIPVKSTPSASAHISHLQTPMTLLSPAHLDIINGSVEQHRRRNSSIAKLLGGHPLHNQQYEEIHQQILVDQSAQNINNNNNNDNGVDSGIQRTRSSITRTLLMNAERTNSMTKLPPKSQTISSPSFSKDFEYLIRREVDNEHTPLALQRNNSIPKVIQNLSSPNNNPNAQLKLKRKRPIPKPPLPTSNIPPFSLHEPFELDTSGTNLNQFHPINPSKRPRYSNPQQYNLPTNQSSYPYPKIPTNSPNYNQDRVSSNNCSPSCNCPYYSHSTKLTLPSPVTHVSPSSPNNNNVNMTSIRKAKSMLVRPDAHEPSRRRSYSNVSNQSDSSLEASSKTTIPLKKRLLDAYNNEQRPTSSL